jgi:aminopeptidase
LRDPRVTNLARILVRYSTKVADGDTCLIEGPSAAEPLVAAIYEEVLEAGGQPIVSLAFEGQQVTFLGRASDAQLEWISPIARWAADESDCRIAIWADTNTRELSGIAPERQTKRRAATRPLMEAMMKRAAAGEHRWVGTMFPTNAHAADAEMSLVDFEDFYFRACLATDEDPVGAWKRASVECHRLADWIQGREEVRIIAPGTDLTLGIAGRTFIAADGEHNMPDGEFFTGPVEDSAQGEIAFALPATIGGREVAGVRLRFESGTVVDASAERGEEFLISMLDTDEGARRLGEIGIGANYGIERGTRSILLDEKIGGTVHLALGASYPETGGTNDSAVHTDLVCDLRDGGRLEVDGELFQEDGRFRV